MEILGHWLLAIAFVAGIVSLALIVVVIHLDTDDHIAARRRNRHGDRW